MAQLISIPVILLLASLQISLSGKFIILHGFADIILVWIIAWVVQTDLKRNWLWVVFAIAVVCYVSAIPWYANLISYLFVLALSVLFKKRLWQSPFLSFLLVLIAGSFFAYFIAFLSLKLSGSLININDAFYKIILPSAIMNLLIALPIYLIARDMVHWVYADEVENVK